MALVTLAATCGRSMKSMKRWARSARLALAGIARLSMNSTEPSSGTMKLTGWPAAAAFRASPTQAMATHSLPVLRSSM
ncbi:hypothetical protein D9M73_297240 [compost metagenome]